MGDFERKGAALFSALIRIKRKIGKLRGFGAYPQLSNIGIKIIKEHKDNCNDGLKISDFAKKLNISKPAATQIISELERNGFVEKIIDQCDKRKTYVKLSEKGEDKFFEIQKKHLEIFDSIAEKFDDNDFGEFIRLIDKFNLFLDDYLANQNNDEREK